VEEEKEEVTFYWNLQQLVEILDKLGMKRLCRL
jgi:hypothetical protein